MRTQYEVTERVRRDGDALTRIGGKFHVGARINGERKPGTQRCRYGSQPGLHEKSSSCVMRQSGHSLPDSSESLAKPHLLRLLSPARVRRILNWSIRRMAACCDPVSPCEVNQRPHCAVPVGQKSKT